jgi:death-on-curing protein
MPRWLAEAAVRAIHAELLAEHGGLDGPVNVDMLGATLARPHHLETYSDPAASLFQFAAAYGFGFARNHCFKDGNKRISLVAMDVFLQLNGFELTAEETEAVIIIEDLAAGKIAEQELSHWIEANTSVLDI